ncbi:MAG: hypothetical protein ABSG31_14975 [Tepidisphaeraceae bacterium]
MNNLSIKQSFRVLRQKWLSLIMGQLIALIFFGMMMRSPLHRTRPLPILAALSVALLIALVPAAYVVRIKFFRAGQMGGGISFPAYSTGNFIFWLACEIVSFFGLIVALLTGSFWPTIVVTAIAIALQAITAPVATKIGEYPKS